MPAERKISLLPKGVGFSRSAQAVYSNNTVNILAKTKLVGGQEQKQIAFVFVLGLRASNINLFLVAIVSYFDSPNSHRK